MSRLRIVAVLVLSLLLIVLDGCIDRFPVTESELYTGDPITPEMIESIFDEISVEVTEKYPTETAENGDLIVYWLDGGTVWHASKECGNVSKADPDKLNSGNVSEANSAGKDRACKICSSEIEVTVSAPKSAGTSLSSDSTAATPIRYPKEYDANGDLIVYWLEGGSVWHESTQCGTVLKADSEKLHSGTAYQAYALGKMRACKVCSADSNIIIELPETTVQTVETTIAVETEAYPKEYDTNGELIVYWLKNGSVWHESTQCGTVLKSDTAKLHSGTVYQAYVSGKTRACKVCSADSNIIIELPETTAEIVETTVTVETETYPKEYDTNGELIVYWLENGSVWHESMQCGTVLKSDTAKLHSGTAYQAYASGKTRACKVCSSDSEIVIVSPETTEEYVESTVAQTEKYPKDYNSEGELIVYWVEGGSVWHESAVCSSLARSSADSIFCGSEAEAVKAGKERACKKCS